MAGGTWLKVMIERTTGIILRLYSLTETSLIIHWITSDFGRLVTVAKGARRLKSNFHGKLDLYYEADMSFARSRRSEIHTLREVGLLDAHPHLRRQLGFLQQVAYCAALIELTTETETPISGHYTLLRDFVKCLSGHTPRPEAVLAFEFRLLEEAGQSPEIETLPLNAETREMASKLAYGSWPEIFEMKVAPAQRQDIIRYLHGFMIYHLGKIPSGRHAALEV